jgi:hypothetical protein
MERSRMQNVSAARATRRDSPPHRWRVFWFVLAGICWLLPALVWAMALRDHPLRLVVGMFVTTICVYVIVPRVLRQKQRRSASQPEPQPSPFSTYEQGYREQSAGAATELPDDVTQVQSRSPWEHEQMAIDYPELPPPQEFVPRRSSA